jgi:NADH-quinone oxidoreductase subunit G
MTTSVTTTDVKTVTITVEGRQVDVPEGMSIIEAAKHAGVMIPYYCYHPGLPVVGVCRMCLVEVEKQPKLMPACSTTVANGQVVHVHSDKAKEARKGVLEMLLINHPLDCPICDQSGECELQDFTYAEGRADSRYREPKRFNPVEDFGGDVLYVPNRCILCTRCVRFMDDVAHDPVLNVSERGDRALIGVFPGHGLTDPWAGNVIDLCPVGALLSKDFLNKARAWELDRAASICPNCSQGCNASLEVRDNVVMRMEPRSNEDVNKFFLCDPGRLDYRWLNRRDRITTPTIGGLPAEWEPAIAAAADALAGRKLHVLASPRLNNEALFLLQRLIQRKNGVGWFTVPTGPEAPLPGVPDLALRADRAPNGRGAELFGFQRVDDAAQRLAALGDADALLVADEELAAATAVTTGAGAIVVVGTTLPGWAKAAAVALPTTNMAEEEGTYTNLRGRVQRYLQAKAGPDAVRPTFAALSDLLIAAGEPAEFWVPSDVFTAIAKANPAFAGMSYDLLGLRGKEVEDVIKP